MKNIFILLAFFCALNANAQNYLISFSGSGASTTVNTVNVENLTKGTTLTLNGDDILRLTITTGVHFIENSISSEIKIYPNPTTGNSNLQINPPESGNASITIYDNTGKQISQVHSYLDKSLQEFRLSGIHSGFYLISVRGSTYQYSGKLLSSSKITGRIRIEKISNNKTIDEKAEKANSKGTQATVDMEYNIGDRLKFTGISGIYSTVRTDIPTEDKTITFNFIQCTDGDGNNYPVVKIGTQTWMAENLKTTILNEGTVVPNITDSIQWSNMTTSGYCWSSNNISNKDTYGALYNWYTVTTGKLCPQGWHIPTFPEWDTLMTFIGGDAFAGVSLKETGTEHWNFISGATNESGFSALGSSNRTNTGIFGSTGNSGEWWSSSEYSSTNAWYRSMMYNHNIVGRNYINEKFGFSVRCLEGQSENELSVEEAFPGIQGVLQDFIINGDTITVEKIKGKYIFQGDIILTEDQLNSGSIKGAGINSFIKKWDCCVFYKINNNMLYRKGSILDAIQNFEENTPLKFMEWTDQQNYVEFVWDSIGCSSYQGMLGGRQEILIADWANTGTIMHEIGHTIGLIHEHSKNDAYLDIIIFWENIDYTLISLEEAKANFGTINTLYKTSNFDFFSLMLYSSYAWNKPGLPTITKHDGSVWPENRKALSVNDIGIIKSIYKPDSIMDIDGNVYRVVTIGTQKWMAENLKTTKYNDNTAIPKVIDNTVWVNLTTPGYCWYNNDPDSFKDTYGALYNWYTVNTGKLCPFGWHVPTDPEWTTLTDYLGGNTIAGGKLKETGTSQWYSPNAEATNEFCFTALPGGFLYSDHFDYIGLYGSWWSSTEDSYDKVWYRLLMYNNGWVNAYKDAKIRGFSVRCIKD